MEKRLEYVASGCSHIRVNVAPNSTPEYQTYLEKVNRAMREISSNSQHHYFSLLYNAHTESSFGSIFENYKSSVYNIHADSGGLQVITQGLNITPEFKLKIYQNQGQYADIGMSFDEIPVTLISNRSTRLDFSNRYFDIEKFPLCAKQTGINLNEQINYFRSINSSCKPYLITQGNSLSTYIQWTETVLNELEGDNINYIGGVAMGAAAFGMGVIEDIRKSFFYSELCQMLPNRHLHLLGVGSISRLLPSIILMKNKMFDSNDILSHVSYDSTTHTSGQNYGRIYDQNLKICSLTSPEDYSRTYSDIVRIFPWVENEFTNQEYQDLLYQPKLKTHEKDIYRRFLTKNLTGFADISKFISVVDSVYNNLELGLEYLTNRSDYYPFKLLMSVYNKEDYYEWEKMFSHNLSSKSYPKSKPKTLF